MNPSLLIIQSTFLQVLGKIIQLLLWNKSFAGVSVKIIKFFEQEGNIFQFVLQNCYLTCRIISRFRKRNVLKMDEGSANEHDDDENNLHWHSFAFIPESIKL